MVNRLQKILDGVENTTRHSDYYEVEAHGGMFVVEFATALAIERQLDQAGELVWIEFCAVLGARHRTKAQFINRITEST